MGGHMRGETPNERTERRQIAEMHRSPADRVVLYVGRDPWRVTTWLGTTVSSAVGVGHACTFPAWGRPSIRRSIRCTIFGTRYVGWYYESSGDYCRLKRAV